MPQPSTSATDNRAKILQAAMTLFSSKGFAATSIRDITQTAGVTNPMVYYYFGSKEDLFVTLLMEAVGEMSTQMHELLVAEMSLRDRLIAILHNHYLMVAESPDLARLFFQARFSAEHSQFVERMSAIDEAFHTSFRDMLERHRDRGELAADIDIEIVYMHLGGLITTPVIEFLKGAPVTLDRAFAVALVDQFLRGVAPQAEGVTQ